MESARARRAPKPSQLLLMQLFGRPTIDYVNLWGARGDGLIIKLARERKGGALMRHRHRYGVQSADGTGLDWTCRGSSRTVPCITLKGRPIHSDHGTNN